MDQWLWIGKTNVKGAILTVKKELILCQMFYEVKPSTVTGQIWTKGFLSSGTLKKTCKDDVLHMDGFSLSVLWILLP